MKQHVASEPVRRFSDLHLDLQLHGSTAGYVGINHCCVFVKIHADYWLTRWQESVMNAIKRQMGSGALAAGQYDQLLAELTLLCNCHVVPAEPRWVRDSSLWPTSGPAHWDWVTPHSHAGMYAPVVRQAVLF